MQRNTEAEKAAIKDGKSCRRAGAGLTSPARSSCPEGHERALDAVVWRKGQVSARTSHVRLSMIAVPALRRGKSRIFHLDAAQRLHPGERLVDRGLERAVGRQLRRLVSTGRTPCCGGREVRQRRSAPLKNEKCLQQRRCTPCSTSSAHRPQRRPTAALGRAGHVPRSPRSAPHSSMSSRIRRSASDTVQVTHRSYFARSAWLHITLANIAYNFD